jgi:hypothetical protein
MNLIERGKRDEYLEAVFREYRFSRKPQTAHDQFTSLYILTHGMQYYEPVLTEIHRSTCQN